MSTEEDVPPTSTSDLLDPLQISITPLSIAELLALPSSELTPSIIESSFTPLSDTEVLSLSTQLISLGKIEDVSLIEFIVQLGQNRGSAEYARLQDEFGEGNENDLRRVGGGDTSKEEFLRGWVYLEEIKRRLDTWNIISPHSSHKPLVDDVGDQDEVSPIPKEDTDKEGSEEMELDDPWGEEENDSKAEVPASHTPSALLDDPWETSTSEPTNSPIATTSKLSVEPSIPPEPVHIALPITLPDFLNQPIPISAMEIASTALLTVLKTICSRHYEEVYPYRFAIIEAIPGWANPNELENENLLPRLGDNDIEEWLSSSSSTTPLSFTLSKLYLPSTLTSITPAIPTHPQPLSSSELTEWYIKHILSLDTLGILDNQLAYVQHGASLGVTGLDEIGEDLSLLSRLVYDSNLSFEQHHKWNLTNWRKSTESETIKAYLSNSTTDSIVNDVRKLVLPYLYVLESRKERAGKSDPNLVDRLLYDCILDLPLELALPIFEVSKATLPNNERIIKNDLDVAKLALSLLYGTEEKRDGIWSIMSSIFECLPVWELDGTDKQSDSELTSTTLDSVATFIRPTKALGDLPSSKDLYLFFNPLPFASLSRALDILDIHLESGEILSRWNIFTGLKFLLQSSRNQKDQLELAEKLVRKQINAGLNDDKWRKLWDDMGRLSGTSNEEEEDGGLLKGALGMLDTQERARIYLGGILSSGNFDIARKVIRRLQQNGSVDDRMVEDVVLETSKEFYLSAESGNLHTGEMKLAYDCLAVAPQTPKIQTEKSFIEATSRLTTFSSLALTPIEIRYTKNPLNLIERILDSSVDSYKHPELMLDLSTKLGASSELEQCLIKIMIGKSALKNDDYVKTQEVIEDVIGVIRNRERKGKRVNREQGMGHRKNESITSITSNRSLDGAAKQQEQEEDKETRLKEELWKLSYSLSSNSGYFDIQSKIQLISYSLELCPPSYINEILVIYKGLEENRIKLDKALKRRRQIGLTTNEHDYKHHKGQLHLDEGGYGNVAGQEERVLGSRTAAKAAKLAFDLSGKYGISDKFRSYSPILGGGSHSNVSGTGTGGGNSPILGQLPFNLSSLSRTTSRSRSPNPAISTTPRLASSVHGFMDEDTRSDAGSEVSQGGTKHHTGGGGTRELFENLNVQGMDEAERVRQGAKRALVRGVGWLLGAEEGEITGD